MEVHVPHDVIFNHILPRVPAESVVRFKCVSKEWHSFLTSDMFKNKHNHLHVDDHENNNKLLVLDKTETSFEFITVDCEAPPSDKVLTPTRRPLPQFRGTTPPSDKVLTPRRHPLPPFKDTTPHDIHILASTHGLVCLRIIKDKRDVGYPDTDLILWNPLTNEYKRFSKSKSYGKYSKIGLYYSCCEDDYKLVCLNLYGDNVYIYSLKSDSWREIDASQSTHILFHDHWSRGTYLNENLYFLQQNSNGRLSSIIRFDTKTEQLSKIETPNVDANPAAYAYFATIMVKSDCIHVCEKSDLDISGFDRTCIKLWKLDEYGNMKEVVTYQLRPYDYDNIISYLIPFHLTNNGNWLMMKERWYSENYQIYKVDLKEKKHNEDKSGIGDKGNIYDDYELYGSVRVLGSVRVHDNIHLTSANHVGYTETFVSPNQHMK